MTEPTCELGRVLHLAEVAFTVAMAVGLGLIIWAAVRRAGGR